MPLLRGNARGTSASLAECQANAIGPAPVAVALRIASEIARALEATGGVHHGVSPAQIQLGHDGSVALVEVGGREDTAYLAPEQVSGSALDRRADVFSLGIVIWELLTGARLFERGTEALTTVAILEEPILDARAVNPDLPAILGEVLATALARDKSRRFDTATAFASALVAAAATVGVRVATPEVVARWVAERMPSALPALGGALPELGGAVPELDIPSAPRRSVSVPTASASPPVPPTSVRTAAAAAFSDVALSVPAQKSIALDLGDDDDFDMQIERNLTTSTMPTATSSRPSGMHASRPSMPHASTGLELGAPQRRSARTEPSSRRVEVGFLPRLLGLVVALVLFGGTAAALFRFLHRAGGRSLTSLLPHAFDGSSATDSGAIALVSLVLAVTVIFVGLRLRPHAWLIVLSGGALLFLALAMVTVTLASTGDNPTPPDGVLLIPYLAPAGVVLLALGMAGRAGRVMAEARGARRLGGVPLALLAGALAFVAFEVSRLAVR